MADITLTLSSIVAVAGAISIICGAYLRIRSVQKDRQKQKELEKALILQEAKETANHYKLTIETKLEHLETEVNAKFEQLTQEINNLEQSIDKDILHIKESYNNEIRYLGSKIEELKDELRTSLSQVITLVSKLIDKD